MKNNQHGDKNVLCPHQIKKEIIEDHKNYEPTIWKVLLDTVGLCPSNYDSENFYNDLDYKFLYKYSFLEYLALHSAGECGEAPVELSDYKLIVMDKIKNENFLEISNSCTGSCEQVYNSLLNSHKSYDITNVKLATDFKSLLKLPTVDKKLIRLKFRKPLTIDRKILHQIHIDIKRLPGQFLTVGNTDLSYMFYNILVLVSHRRPCLGYIQGMADFLVPFVHEFARVDLVTAESGAYFCYLKIIDRVQENLTGLQSGLLFQLNCKLEQIDPELYLFLKGNGLELHLFAFRWFNCLYFREFPYCLYKQIFTTMLAYEGLNDFLIYFGISILLNFKGTLLSNDFSDNILFLQNLNSYGWGQQQIESLLDTTLFYFKTCGKLAN